MSGEVNKNGKLCLRKLNKQASFYTKAHTSQQDLCLTAVPEKWYVQHLHPRCACRSSSQLIGIFGFLSLGFLIPQGYTLRIKSKELANHSARTVNKTKLIYIFYG